MKRCKYRNEKKKINEIRAFCQMEHRRPTSDNIGTDESNWKTMVSRIAFNLED